MRIEKLLVISAFSYGGRGGGARDGGAAGGERRRGVITV